jgi:hypothetical protein
MTVKKTVSGLFITFFAAGTLGQSIVVDMDTSSGIQATTTSTDTATPLITIQIRVTGAVDLFSYQYKVPFDTSRLTYMGAQLDGGFSGEKNILTHNGGMPIGVYQLQLNPPASDTIEISGTITGTDPAKSVAGDGLVGVIFFRSKTAPGDSCGITVCSGFYAPCGGNLVPFDHYSGGEFHVTLPVSAASRRANIPITSTIQNLLTVAVNIGTTEYLFQIPAAHTAAVQPLTFKLFTIDGKFITASTMRPVSATHHQTILVPVPAASLAGGVYIGSLGTGSSSVTKMISCK